MAFELGKFYRSNGGRSDMAILVVANTTLYGKCFIAECAEDRTNFEPVSMIEGSDTGWYEISKEEWMENFS